MSALAPQDIRWLDAAVRAAEPFLGTTAENPAAAAFVVDPAENVLIARAITARGGRPHAEALALEAAGDLARGATLYCTIEPCHHWGRTPPCVDAVVRAGIARVVVGMTDPDPRTAGKSIALLRSRGIEVVVADHAPSQRLHEAHRVRHELGRPFVTLVQAVSADGMIGKPGEGRVAVGEAACRWLDLQRAMSDALLIGGATAEADDPQLVVRLPGLEERTPLRIILAGRRGIDRRLNLIGGFSGHRVAIIAESGREVSVPASVAVISVPGSQARPDIIEALQALHAKGIARLLVEPGAALVEAFLSAGVVDRFELLQSPAGIGAGGIRATPKGTLEKRLAAAGLREASAAELGTDTLRTFDRGS